MYKILIADDHPIVRKGLRQILEEGGIVRKVEEAGSGKEAVEKVRNGSFDVALLDISMPEMSGLEALDEIKKLRPSMPVLILSIYAEEEYAVRALRSGASGYMTKKSAPDELIAAIRKIVRGGRYISPSLADFLASHLTGESDKPLHETLSTREFQVMRMIAAGRSLKEIAYDMSLSPKTISTFRTRILQKMQMQNNADLIQYAIKNKLTD
ncbi:MAG: response regulator transcription factor [Nitrospirae bacterium]|nr:response regulator transcription factor [Nitrospirota bacterium]